MKKVLLSAAVALGALAANAQAVQQPGFFDNWSIGLDGGVTTPMYRAPFWGDMRGVAGLHIQKQITPAFAMGVESAFAVNTSSWRGHVHSTTAFDNSYVGVYGAVDLFNFFGGYNCGVRPFTIEAVAGAGWGHEYVSRNDQQGDREDWNYFETKVGLNFNFNVSKHVTISLKPSINWNMNNGRSFYNPGQWEMTATAYDKRNATFNLMAGLTYNFGPGFQCVQPYNQAEIDALNGQINDLRGQLDACVATAGAWQAKAGELAAELEACKNKKPEVQVVKEVANQYNSVRFVFFRIGSSVITSDQLPNVTMIADYMKSHPASKVVIKGYASKDGNYDFNVKLAKARAESVKNALVNKYKIKADRITAEGEGIGNMFEEESWNRVSICTLEQD
ncbi:MAG: OmpA family protein [Muribaculaceae bacterium]|nr:OmpA family protein [Muribaculaceae bacterium]